MAAPYSLDLRERVVAAVAAGMSRAQAAAHYQVSHSSAIRWTRRQAETGSPAALPMGGKKPFTLANEEAWRSDLPRERLVIVRCQSSRLYADEVARERALYR